MSGSKVEHSEIKTLVRNYIEQDNAHTAWPYAYVVQQQAMHLSPKGYGEETVYCCHEAEYYDYPSEEALIAALEENGWENPEIQEYEITRHWQDQQWFFTKVEAEKHLEVNGHNYKKTRLYVKYMFRHSEAEILLRHLFSIAGEDYDAHRK